MTTEPEQDREPNVGPWDDEPRCARTRCRHPQSWHQPACDEDTCPCAGFMDPLAHEESRPTQPSSGRAVASHVEPDSRCPAAANQRGEHIPCDLNVGHGSAHSNRERELIWLGREGIDTQPERRRACYLSTVELHLLDRACRDLWTLDDTGGVYLVGSASERPDFRDVDVRLILPDERFDALFGSAPELWGLFCYAVSRQLGADTGLPVDFQVQRQTEANEHKGIRNPLGAGVRSLSRTGRRFAGGGDATKFTEAGVDHV